MPTYVFQNTVTDDIFEVQLKISELDEFKKVNPDYKQLTTAPNIVGGVSGRTHKNDGGFNDLMNRIGKANPGSHVADKYVSRDSKQVKVDNVLKKHGFKK